MISLFEHNQKAYDSAVEMLNSAGRAAIIHPTGTGKSFIGFKLCEQHPHSRVCWLSPSSYIFETQLEELKAASDGYSPENVSFYTYAKLSQLNSEDIYSIAPDFIVLDEFHRCGAPVWGEAVQRVLDIYPETPVLGLSATNVRYLDSQRDMALELFGGNIASEMTLGEAVVRGILTPPKYVLSVFSYRKDLERYQRRVAGAKSAAVRDKAEMYLEALRRSLENAEGLDEIFHKHMPDRAGKYIVFCADLQHMQQMQEKASQWFGKIDSSPYIYSVYSEDPGADKAFREFKSNNDPQHLKLLYCIDALNEGVHIKDINGVILLRPTVSPIIYKQQIGRAMSANTKHDVVIFDIVMNIDNLYSISMVKQEMEMAINEYIYAGEGLRIVNDSFNVIDEVCDCRQLFEQLNDTLSASWKMMYEHARAYYKQHGDLEVPKRYKTSEGYSLGAWLAVQRKVYKGQVYGVLTERQKKKLDEIGMRWCSISDLSWEKHISAAREYYGEHGNLACKSDYVSPEGVCLGKWLSALRTAQNSQNGMGYRKLSPEQKEQLDSMGMVWDLREQAWEEKFAAAKKYYHEHRNLNVPSNYVNAEGIALGTWISRVRNSYNSDGHGGLSESQISRLEAIGMNWENRFDSYWLEVYAEAKKYYAEHGSLDVPSTYKSDSGIQLGRWILRQRESANKAELDLEKKALLDELGMVWKKPDQWKLRYDIARAYYEENGDVNIPQTVVINGVWIGKWLSEQRKKKGRLSKEQITLLENLGVRW